jgi:hypothetical protein
MAETTNHIGDSPTCPSCGHCPHCGRGRTYPVTPYYPWPYTPTVPWYPSYPLPYTITYTTSGGNYDITTGGTT